MRQIACDCSAVGVTEIARTLCELLEWKRPSGRGKNQECRQLLERLQHHGWLQLPAVRNLGPRGPRRIARTTHSEPQPEITGVAGELDPLILSRIEPHHVGDSRLWNELIDRYHYLGYRVPVGAQLRYFVRSQRLGEPILACLQWSSPAWKMAPRDRWIGWNPQQRVRNLQYIVNNSRFLPDPSLGSGGGTGEPDPCPLCSPTPPGLGAPLRLPTPVAGNSCGRPPFLGHLLPSGKLDSSGTNPRTGSDGSTSPAARRFAQMGLRLSSLSWRAGSPPLRRPKTIKFSEKKVLDKGVRVER